jgi:hypothetical protein
MVRLPADVGGGVDHASGNVDGLSGGQTRPLPFQLDLEVAVEHMNRLGLVAVAVARQGPADREVVDEQAKRAAGVLGGQVDLGANAAGHPHDASGVCHALTIAVEPRDTPR